MGTKKNIALGIGAALGAAAGAYWLYGSKHAAKHQKMAKSWMLKARADVVDAVEKVRSMDKGDYMKIVDDVMKRYASQKKATRKEIAYATNELKKSWQHIVKHAKATAKKR